MAAQRGPSLLQAEPGTPPWGVRLVRALNERLSGADRPATPQKVYDVADASALPDPARCRFCVVYVIDIARLAVSNGSAWIRQDTGAAL